MAVLHDGEVTEGLQPADQATAELLLGLKISQSLVVCEDLEFYADQVELEGENVILDSEQLTLGGVVMLLSTRQFAAYPDVGASQCASVGKDTGSK